jgi:Zn-dependent membrane protease YugP
MVSPGESTCADGRSRSGSAIGFILVIGGFLFTFTTDGAVMIFIGLGIMLSGVLALVRLPLWFAAGVGLAVSAYLIAQLAINGS